MLNEIQPNLTPTARFCHTNPRTKSRWLPVNVGLLADWVIRALPAEIGQEREADV